MQHKNNAKKTLTIFRRGIFVGIIQNLVIKAQQVNRDGVLPGKVLLSTSQESLGEVEARDPELRGCPIVVPVLEEFEASDEVVHVASKGLQGWVGPLHPHAWDLALKNTEDNFFQVSGHDH